MSRLTNTSRTWYKTCITCIGIKKKLHVFYLICSCEIKAKVMLISCTYLRLSFPAVISFFYAARNVQDFDCSKHNFRLK